jgi:hypothetical protein
MSDMKRREFITLLGGAVVMADCGPRVAGALSDHVRPHRVPRRWGPEAREAS